MYRVRVKLMPSSTGNSRASHFKFPPLKVNLLIFLTDWALEATNNVSERALRPAPVRDILQKISDGFQWAVKRYPDIRSVLKTAR